MLVRISRNKKMNPWTLVAHAHPSLGKSASSNSGNIMPPSDPPIVAIPVAFARLVRKKCPMDATAGVTISDVPVPPRIPKTTRK
jgi:hypothetical protein